MTEQLKLRINSPDDEFYYDEKGNYIDVSAWGSVRNFMADQLGGWECPVNRDAGGIPCRWKLTYECSHCDTEWTSEWSCQCDDECPKCGRTYSPSDAEDQLDDEDVS